MEDPIDLEENLKLLTSGMETLDSLLIDVKEKGERIMDAWVQKATEKGYEVESLQSLLDEVKISSRTEDNLSIREEAKNMILKLLSEVKTLIQEGNFRSNPMVNLIRKLGFKKLKRYAYDELESFTLNFEKKIGAGTFGDVYFGKFPNGLEIAVKVLVVNDVVESMFEDEVRTMGKTYHQNVVKLFGFCFDDKLKAIVYEYLKNGSLDRILYKKDSNVEWPVFYQIAIDMAKALAYLHDGCSDQIIHCNVKATNVLLDARLSPRVTDFGLFNLLNRKETPQMFFSDDGTLGYVAPELWSPFSLMTSKCDVYSFGMVLFEILERRVNQKGNDWFPEKIWNMFAHDKLEDVIIGCGIREKDWKKAKVLSRVAFWCAQHTPETRPSMSTVAAVLELEILVNMPPNPFLPSDPSTSRMQPEVHYPEVSSRRYSDFSSSRNDVSIIKQQFMQGPSMSLEETEVQISKLDYGEAKRYSGDDVSIIKQQFMQGPSMSLEETEVQISKLDYGEANRYSGDDVNIIKQQFMQGPSLSLEETEVQISKLDFGEAKRDSHDDVSIIKQQFMQGPSMSLEETEVQISKLDFGEAKRYSRDELVNLTSNFDEQIGSGAHGKVFKGRLSNGTEVAVKVLGMKAVVGETFVAEVRTVGKTYHKNLVKLLGFCLEGNTKALVYEYMENGSLDKILYTKPIKMEWEKLYSTAIEIAKALAYLHHGCENQIIHYDIKAANILLDSNHCPKLADFGLARLMDIGETHHTLTRVKGTMGFMAPEVYSPFSHATFKCDVYSFGMLLFEILGMERNHLTQEWFPKYVWDEFKKGNLYNVIEERGIDEKYREKASILAMVALWCAQFTPEARPSMRTVVTVLDKEVPVNSPPDPFYPTDSLAKMRFGRTSPNVISTSNEGRYKPNFMPSRGTIKVKILSQLFNRGAHSIHNKP